MRRVKPLIQISYAQSIAFAAFLVLYEFLTYVSNDMIMPGMHQVVQDFQVSTTHIATSVTAFMLGGSSLQLFLGPLADSYGRRRMMIIGVVVFLLSTLLLASSQNIFQFMLERFFQGMGICFIGAVGYATLQDIFNDTDAVKLTAIMANLSIIAPLMGPLLGAFIIFHASWRLIFLIIAAFTFFSLWGLWKYMPEPLGQTDIEGKKIEAQSFNLKNIFNNYLTLFKSKTFISLVCMYGLMGIPCMVWISLSPVMIISSTKSSLLTYGLWQIPMFSSFIFANTLLQRWIEKIGLDRLMHIGVITVILSLASSSLIVYLVGETFKSLIPIFVCYFFGYAIASSPIYRKLFSVTTITKGTTGALISLGIMLIQSIGIEVGNQLFKAKNYLNLSFLFILLAIGIAILYRISRKQST
jgi:DHA1 family multidrug/chloramphenicol efflux transport protein-like MFS transporter